MKFITFNKFKMASNLYRADIYSWFITRGHGQNMPGKEGIDEKYWKGGPSTTMFYLGMVFAVGDQQSKQLALRDAGLSAPPLGDMDFAKGHDHAAETYNKIRRGEIRW